MAAHGAFDRLVDARTESASRQLRLVVELPAVRQSLGVTAAEGVAVPQAASLTENYCRKIGAQFCVITDPRGRWLGQTNAPRDRASRSAIASVIDNARLGRSSKGVVSLVEGPAMVVAEPARAGADVIGALAAGYRLDDAMAAEVSKVTRGHVAFVCPDDVVCGSNMPVANRAALTALFENNAAVVDDVNAPPTHWMLAGTRFVAGVYRLSADPIGATASADKTGGPPRSGRPAAPPVRLVLLEDWSSAERALSQIRTALAWVGVWTVGVAVGGTILLSRRLTRPLRDLAECGSRNRPRQLGTARAGRRTRRSAHDGRGVQPHDRDAQPLAREATSQAAAAPASRTSASDRSPTRRTTRSSRSTAAAKSCSGTSARRQVFGYAEREGARAAAHAADPARRDRPSPPMRRRAAGRARPRGLAARSSSSARRRDGS